MRKLSLKTYSEYSLKSLSYSKSLSKKTLVKEYESNHRLFAPLLCWLILERKVDTLIKLHQCDEKLEKSIAELKKLTDELTVTREDIDQVVLNYLKESNEIELIKYAHSYEAENQRRDENEIKKETRETYFLLKEKANVSDYYLCMACKINQGNFHAFFHHNQNDKLSKAKCKQVVKLLSQLAFEG